MTGVPPCRMALAILALLSACAPIDAGPAAAAVPLADPARGRDIADRNCSLCHAIMPGGRAAHPRAPAFADLGARYPMASLRAGLATGQVIGHTGMPQIELAPAQIDDLIAYLRSIAAAPDARR